MEDENVTDDHSTDEIKIESLDDIRNLANEGELESEPAQEEDTEESVEPAYEPNYGYKVKDEELEFDEIWKGNVTSKEHEEHLRDLYTSRAGLHQYKEKYSTLENDYGSMRSQNEKLVGGYKAIMDARDKGDFQGLSELLGIDTEYTAKMALAMDDYKNLPEEQKTILQNYRQMSEENATLRSQVDTHKAESETESINREANELRQLAESEDYADVQELIKGLDGNLALEAYEYGTNLWKTKQQGISLKDALDTVAERYRKTINYYSANQQQAQEADSGLPVLNREESLPNVKGNNVAQMSEPMTLDKIKAEAAAIPTL
jgi:hypothetical protein